MRAAFSSSRNKRGPRRPLSAPDMSVAIVTGAGGLVGSEAVRYFAGQGMDVVGIDNDMRAYFFGREASTTRNLALVQRQIARYTHYAVDVRDESAVGGLFRRYGHAIDLI